MKFHPDDEDDDDDSSSVIDISEFLNESTLATLAPGPSISTKEGVTNEPPTTGTSNLDKPSPESNDQSQPTDGAHQRQGQETVRVIFGDSIARWREPAVVPPNDSSNILVWKQTIGATPITWQNSRLRVDGSQLALQTENGLSYVPKEVMEPETCSTFVEAVAIWDESQHAYRLEIPQRIAMDLIPRTRQGQSQLSEPCSAVADPLTQSRQAEEALRKRKQRPNNNNMKRPSKRGNTTFTKSSKR